MTTMKVFDGTQWQVTSLPVGSATSRAWVGPDAPPGTPVPGDQWYDTDEPNVLSLPIPVNSGGTGATVAPTARTNLAVPFIGNSTSTAGAPTAGTYVRGDLWLDSNNIRWMCTTAGTPGTWANMNSGEELAYNQVTSVINVTATAQSAPNLLIDGTTRNYDGTPVIVEVNIGNVSAMSAGAQVYLSIWDGATDLGYVSGHYCSAGAQLTEPCHIKRRLTPTPGSHNFKLCGVATAGSGQIYAGAGGVATWTPMFVRVTRA